MRRVVAEPAAAELPRWGQTTAQQHAMRDEIAKLEGTIAKLDICRRLLKPEVAVGSDHWASFWAHLAILHELRCPFFDYPTATLSLVAWHHRALPHKNQPGCPICVCPRHQSRSTVAKCDNHCLRCHGKIHRAV